MASISTIILTTLIVLIGGAAGYLYIFGIPAAYKQEMEEKIVEQMGENEASDLAKGAMHKIPESEQRDLNGMKRNLNNALGGENNPLNKLAGGEAKNAEKEFANFASR